MFKKVIKDFSKTEINMGDRYVIYRRALSDPEYVVDTKDASKTKLVTRKQADEKVKTNIRNLMA
jgi:IS1 family transposase